MPRIIDRFEGEYHWLSNFWPAIVLLDRVDYPTVEHAYQAAKFDSVNMSGTQFTRAIIRAARTPAEAKKLGRIRGIRRDWNNVRLDAMLDLLRQKFDHPELLEKLKATGDATLIKGNNYGDVYWGVCDGKGENHLGKLLMQVRKEINGN